MEIIVEESIVRTLLPKLKAAGAEGWEDVKDDMDNALREVEEAYNDIVESMQQFQFQ